MPSLSNEPRNAPSVRADSTFTSCAAPLAQIGLAGAEAEQGAHAGAADVDRHLDRRVDLRAVQRCRRCRTSRGTRPRCGPTLDVHVVRRAVRALGRADAEAEQGAHAGAADVDRHLDRRVDLRAVQRCRRCRRRASTRPRCGPTRAWPSWPSWPASGSGGPVLRRPRPRRRSRRAPRRWSTARCRRRGPAPRRRRCHRRSPAPGSARATCVPLAMPSLSQEIMPISACAAVGATRRAPAARTPTLRVLRTQVFMMKK